MSESRPEGCSYGACASEMHHILVSSHTGSLQSYPYGPMSELFLSSESLGYSCTSK